MLQEQNISDVRNKRIHTTHVSILCKGINMCKVEVRLQSTKKVLLSNDEM